MKEKLLSIKIETGIERVLAPRSGRTASPVSEMLRNALKAMRVDDSFLYPVPEGATDKQIGSAGSTISAAAKKLGMATSYRSVYDMDGVVRNIRVWRTK